MVFTSVCLYEWRYCIPWSLWWSYSLSLGHGLRSSLPIPKLELQYLDVFSYLFCLLFGDFMQLQKLMWELKWWKLVINVLTLRDPLIMHKIHGRNASQYWRGLKGCSCVLMKIPWHGYVLLLFLVINTQENTKVLRWPILIILHHPWGLEEC